MRPDYDDWRRRLDAASWITDSETGVIKRRVVVGSAFALYPSGRPWFSTTLSLRDVCIEDVEADEAWYRGVAAECGKRGMVLDHDPKQPWLCLVEEYWIPPIRT